MFLCAPLNARNCVYVCLICVNIFVAKGVVVHKCVAECAWKRVINHNVNMDVVGYETPATSGNCCPIPAISHVL